MPRLWGLDRLVRVSGVTRSAVVIRVVSFLVRR